MKSDQPLPTISISILDTISKAEVEKLFRQYYPPLVAFAQNILGNRPDAEDVAGEAICTVLTGNTFITCPEHLKNTLYICTRHRAFNLLKRRARGARIVQPLSDDMLEVEQTVSECLDEISEGIDMLPGREKEVMELWMKGFADKQIAALMSLGESVVQKTRKKAFAFLARLIRS